MIEDEVGYSVPAWDYEKQENDLTALLESLGGFISDSLDYAVQDAKTTLAIPHMLHNMMLANVMLVGLMQRQNDMINESQEMATSDLWTFQQSAPTANTWQLITPIYKQPMLLRSFVLSRGNAIGLLQLSVAGDKTMGNNNIFFVGRFQSNGNVTMSNIAQVIPANCGIYAQSNDTNAYFFSADIRPLVRYKDSMFRSQRNVGF